MIDQSKLYALVAEVYDHLKVQAEALYHLQCVESALVAALMETHPEIAESYEKNYRAFEGQNCGRHAANIHSLDAIIQSLKAGKLSP